MSGKQSGSVDRALALVREGGIPFRVAKECGLAVSTIYRALKRARLAALPKRKRR